MKWVIVVALFLNTMALFHDLWNGVTVSFTILYKIADLFLQSLSQLRYAYIKKCCLDCLVVTLIGLFSLGRNRSSGEFYANKGIILCIVLCYSQYGIVKQLFYPCNQLVLVRRTIRSGNGKKVLQILSR